MHLAEWMSFITLVPSISKIPTGRRLRRTQKFAYHYECFSDTSCACLHLSPSPPVHISVCAARFAEPKWPSPQKMWSLSRLTWVDLLISAMPLFSTCVSLIRLWPWRPLDGCSLLLPLLFFSPMLPRCLLVSNFAPPQLILLLLVSFSFLLVSCNRPTGICLLLIIQWSAEKAFGPVLFQFHLSVIFGGKPRYIGLA